jgi:HTH-type transcriptional regulator / antitoxin HigA
MATSRGTWAPEWSVAPGEVLIETLDERGMTQAELARRMARPLKTISEIANSKAAITPDTAIQLELALGISARFWNGLETQYRESLARARALEDLGSYTTWTNAFPLAELARRGVITARASSVDATRQLLEFFRVSNPVGWEQQWARQAVGLRQSQAFEYSPHALAAWLRLGEVHAEAMDVGPFDPRALRAILPETRNLTRLASFPTAVRRLQAAVATAGVAFVVEEELPGARVSGAARTLADGRALLQVSLRFRSDDQFWHSVHHEAGHLVRRGRREGFVEDRDPAQEGPEVDSDEAAADAYARDLLIPPAEYAEFVARGVFTPDAVIAFAELVGVSKGIVTGRLEHDGVVARGRLAHLKRTYPLIR